MKTRALTVGMTLIPSISYVEVGDIVFVFNVKEKKHCLGIASCVDRTKEELYIRNWRGGYKFKFSDVEVEVHNGDIIGYNHPEV